MWQLKLISLVELAEPVDSTRLLVEQQRDALEVSITPSRCVKTNKHGSIRPARLLVEQQRDALEVSITPARSVKPTKHKGIAPVHLLVEQQRDALEVGVGRHAAAAGHQQALMRPPIHHTQLQGGGEGTCKQGCLAAERCRNLQW